LTNDRSPSGDRSSAVVRIADVRSVPFARCVPTGTVSHVTTDDQNGPARMPIVPGMYFAEPLTQPPPPTGSLVPPPPPPLEPELDVPSRPAIVGTTQLPDGLRHELEELLYRAGGQLRAAFEQHRTGLTSASDGTAAELALRVRTILGEPWSGTPGRARGVAGTVRVLLRARDLSSEARQYLVQLRLTMLDLAESDAGQLEEQARLDANSAVLRRDLSSANGVYVFTYPHYWRYPWQAETNRRVLHVGRTANGAWQRVLDQARTAGAPEDPVLLRVYTSPDPAASEQIEQVFKRLLESADHNRVLTGTGGQEWFTTSLEFLDEIARALGIEIRAGTEPVL
jgi:hypothetical protein